MPMEMVQFSPANSLVLREIERKVLTAAQTNVVFTGLDGNADGAYFCSWQVQANAAISNYTLEPNGLATNQRSISFGNDESGYAIYNQSFSLVGYNIKGNGSFCDGQFRLWARSGIPRRYLFQMASVNSAMTAGFQVSGGGTWNDTSTNITSLEIEAGAASGFGAASVFTLYMMRSD